METIPDEINKTTLKELPTVIIGGGTVGLMLAHELMQQGKKIILIEAGGETFQSFNDNEYTSKGHKHNGISIGRTKGMGGTTNLWGGQLTEFIQDDIEQSNTFEQPVWPIPWMELNQYYKAVYNKLGLSDVCPLEAEKLYSLDQKGDLELFYTRWLKQPNFKYHFLEDLKHSDLVTIHQNTNVTNLDFDNNKCTAILCNTNGQVKKIDNFNKIVLAHGTIEICRLLLIAAQSENCPFKDNLWIGKFFQDHLNFRVGRIIKPSKLFFKRFANILSNGEKLQPKIRINNKEQDGQYLGICGFFAFDSDISHHLDNFKQFSKAVLGRSQQKTGVKDFFKMLKNVLIATPIILLVIYHYLKNNRIYIPFKSTVTLSLQSQQISISESSISISTNEFDSLGRAKAVLNWKIDGREFDKIQNFCKGIKDYLTTNHLGDLQFEKWFERECIELNGKWLEHVSDVYHQAGGTILSNSKDSGVVDINQKIHNTDNVFVCGASVMPTSSYGNITLTALALSMRLANHLTSNNKQK